METFTLGFPPDGQSVDPSRSKALPIPDSVRAEVVSRFEENYPRGYVLAFADKKSDVFGFYSRSHESWRRISETNYIGIYPTKPAKGGGYILLGYQERDGDWPDVYLASSRFTDDVFDWMKMRAERLANIVGVPLREFPAGCDA